MPHSLSLSQTLIFLSLSLSLSSFTMNRRIRASTKPFSSSSPTRSEPFHKYLKPGALAQIRDSRISAHRTHRVNSLYLLSSSSISPHRTTPPSSPPSSNAAAHQTPVNAFTDGIPCFSGRIYGPRCPQRKKLVAAKSVLFLNPIPNSVQDSPDSVIDSFSNDILLAHWNGLLRFLVKDFSCCREGSICSCLYFVQLCEKKNKKKKNFVR